MSKEGVPQPDQSPDGDSENLEEEPSPDFPTWRQEYNNEDLKSLRSLAPEKATTEELWQALQDRFTIREDDVSLINDMGAKRRKESESKTKDYDYSAEVLVHTSFMSHQLKDMGVTADSQNAFLSYAKILERAEREAPNNRATIEPTTERSYHELVDEAGKRLLETVQKHKEKQLVQESIWWSADYLMLMENYNSGDETRKPHKRHNEKLGKYPFYHRSPASSARKNDYHAYQAGLHTIQQTLFGRKS